MLRAASLILLALLAFGFWRNIGPIRTAGGSNADVDFSTRTIERIRSGEPYYQALGEELRRGRYPTRRVVNWRTPVHYRLVAALSIERTGSLLTVLAVAAIVLSAMSRGIWGVLMITGAMLPALLMRPAAIVLPEVMCGVLVTISLGMYCQEWWVAAAICGLLALFIRELALPYAVVCAGLAILSRRRSEMLLWVIGLGIYVAYYAIHTHAVLQYMRADDTVREHAYVAWQGYTFVLNTVRVNGWLLLLPALVTPIFPVAGLAGIAAPRVPAQVASGLLVYALAFCVAGQPFHFYWGFVTVGLWAYALTYTFAGTRELLRAWKPLRN